MEDLAQERLAQILAWMKPHERDAVVSACLGRFSSVAEYARRELAEWFEGDLWWLAEHIAYEHIAATWLEEGRITVVEDPGDDGILPGLFVLRGSW